MFFSRCSKLFWMTQPWNLLSSVSGKWFFIIFLVSLLKKSSLYRYLLISILCLYFSDHSKIRWQNFFSKIEKSKLIDPFQVLLETFFKKSEHIHYVKLNYLYFKWKIDVIKFKFLQESFSITPNLLLLLKWVALKQTLSKAKYPFIFFLAYFSNFSK